MKIRKTRISKISYLYTHLTDILGAESFSLGQNGCHRLDAVGREGDLLSGRMVRKAHGTRRHGRGRPHMRVVGRTGRVRSAGSVRGSSGGRCHRTRRRESAAAGRWWKAMSGTAAGTTGTPMLLIRTRRGRRHVRIRIRSRTRTR